MVSPPHYNEKLVMNNDDTAWYENYLHLRGFEANIFECMHNSSVENGMKEKKNERIKFHFISIHSIIFISMSSGHICYWHEKIFI